MSPERRLNIYFAAVFLTCFLTAATGTVLYPEEGGTRTESALDPKYSKWTVVRRIGEEPIWSIKDMRYHKLQKQWQYMGNPEALAIWYWEKNLEAVTEDHTLIHLADDPGHIRVTTDRIWWVSAFPIHETLTHYTVQRAVEPYTSVVWGTDEKIDHQEALRRGLEKIETLYQGGAE